MKIKDYQCECGSNQFFFNKKSFQVGIYCAKCGKFLKWANRNEQNLCLQETQINVPCRLTNSQAISYLFPSIPQTLILEIKNSMGEEWCNEYYQREGIGI